MAWTREEMAARAAKELHLAIRGFHGEGTESLGDFFQISNQTTLGRSEHDIVEQFAGSILPQFVEYERAARRDIVFIGRAETFITPSN